MSSAGLKHKTWIKSWKRKIWIMEENNGCDNADNLWLLLGSKLLKSLRLCLRAVIKPAFVKYKSRSSQGSWSKIDSKWQRERFKIKIESILISFEENPMFSRGNYLYYCYKLSETNHIVQVQMTCQRPGSKTPVLDPYCTIRPDRKRFFIFCTEKKLGLSLFTFRLYIVSNKNYYYYMK